MSAGAASAGSGRLRPDWRVEKNEINMSVKRGTNAFDYRRAAWGEKWRGRSAFLVAGRCGGGE